LIEGVVKLIMEKGRLKKDKMNIYSGTIPHPLTRKEALAATKPYSCDPNHSESLCSESYTSCLNANISKNKGYANSAHSFLKFRSIRRNRKYGNALSTNIMIFLKSKEAYFHGVIITSKMKIMLRPPYKDSRSILNTRNF
jgi:hypothetical protein